MKQEQTTRRIAIVGAGQAALCLAVSLQRTAGYEVTFVTDRSAEEVRRGPILASQVLFGPALDGEAAAGVETWVDEAPDIRDLVLTLGTAQGEAEAPTMRAPLEFASRRPPGWSSSRSWAPRCSRSAPRPPTWRS